MNTSNERRSPVAARLELSATILLIVVALLVGGLTVWDRVYPPAARAAPSEPPLPKDPVFIDGVPSRGDRNAKVALIEFSEFECPYCGKSAREVMPEIDRKYVTTGKVSLAWRHYPLPMHKQAQKAAEAAECAGRSRGVVMCCAGEHWPKVVLPAFPASRTTNEDQGTIGD
jgi:hypothetical protein